MATKIRVGILFGGRSAEHEVSLRSAQNIISALDTAKYEPVLIGIDKAGHWLTEVQSKALLDGKGSSAKGDTIPKLPAGLNVIFPILHGPYGEDGTVQGFLKLAGIPFVGPSILGSAVGMDKDITKRLLKESGITVAEGFVFHKHETKTIKFATIKNKLGLPLFVKPANAGSSVGVTKAHDQKEFAAAVSNAFLFDTKILVEKFVPGREIECAVLGNEYPTASIPGEIIPDEEFYSYDAKYASTSGSVVKIPADIPKKVMSDLQKTAVKAYKVLSLEGLTRVDFFLTKGNKLLINEVNTIPGFTSISMYPKMWEASGLSYSKLIDRLIELALERHAREISLKTSI